MKSYGFIIISLVALLSSGCSEEKPRFGAHTARLSLCGINNEAVRSVIDEEILPYVQSNRRRFEGMYFYIDIYVEKKYRFFEVTGLEIDDSSAYLKDGYGWFERGGYQFVVDKSAKKYFTFINDSIHEFRYTYGDYEMVTYDPPEWGMLIDGETYELWFRPYAVERPPRDEVVARRKKIEARADSLNKLEE